MMYIYFYFKLLCLPKIVINFISEIISENMIILEEVYSSVLIVCNNVMYFLNYLTFLLIINPSEK